MKEVTTHYAKTHLSALLKEVQEGETVIILQGRIPVGRLTSVENKRLERPKVGTVTSEPVAYAEDAFEPMSDADLEEWGL